MYVVRDAIIRGPKTVMSDALLANFADTLPAKTCINDVRCPKHHVLSILKPSPIS